MVSFCALDYHCAITCQHSCPQAVDWKWIQARLGHASVVTTMEIYAHLEREDHQQAYQAFVDRKEAARAQKQQKNS